MAYSNHICLRCKSSDSWKIRLRGAETDNEEERCMHVVCVNCMLIYLEEAIYKDKPRIKCPSPDLVSCHVRIHENDIRALLDPECLDLDLFMMRQTRELLLHMHDSTVVVYALGGNTNTQNCPRCKNVYSKKIGCNYVRCPNLRCNTWFCWDCGAKDIDWTHFIVSKCNPKWDDVLKELYLVTFLLFAGGCTLLYLTISVCLGLFVFSPLIITFAGPAIILECINRQWKLQPDKRNGKSSYRKRLCCFWSLYACLYVIFIPVCAITAALSLFVSALLFSLYIIILFIKLIPIVGQIMCLLDMMQCVTGCCGYGDWLQRYKQSKDEKETERLAERQFREQRSERLINPNLII